MRRTLRHATLCAVSASLALAAWSTSEARAGQARSDLLVTIRVIERCTARLIAGTLAQSCTTTKPTITRVEPPWQRPDLDIVPMRGTEAPLARVTSGGMTAASYITIIY